jgi:hypothetical protein
MLVNDEDLASRRSSTMESAAETKTVRLPVFGGAHKGFQVWWIRFMAFAAVYKIPKALKIGGETVMPVTENTVIDLTNDAGRAQAAAVRRNAIAMANLTVASTTEATIRIVYKAMSVEWPSGLAHLVVAALFKKCQPQDLITKLELRQKF